MYDILDFDANFAAYCEKWMQMNKGRFANIEQMEDAMPDVYMHWLSSPAAFLGGEKPEEYFQKYDDAPMLVNWVAEYEAAGVPVPDVLLERITNLGQKSVRPLIRAAADPDNPKGLRVTALNLLKEIDCGEAPMETCFAIIDRREGEDEVADVAAELLQNIGDACVPDILSRIDEVSDEARETYLDVLCNFPGDERIFTSLMAAFDAHPEKLAMYASLLGKLGDDRALEPLYESLKQPDINYLDYLEVRNAIEMLGGTVDGERDFSGDPYYETLKGV